MCHNEGKYFQRKRWSEKDSTLPKINPFHLGWAKAKKRRPDTQAFFRKALRKARHTKITKTIFIILCMHMSKLKTGNIHEANES